MLKGLTDWNTATSKVLVTNHKCLSLLKLITLLEHPQHEGKWTELNAS